ncbi:hypothetical protein [Mycolicibacterium goodii]|uniref:hypothetical protein n=1 Tax=Mycolicibacterium goodii TaxID=134601 RepID=UPI0027DFCA2B|nr:hypothetical protein [Mycolicibacterium goodii]
MSAAVMPAGALPVGMNVELAEDQRSGRLDGPLYRVVGVQGVLRDLRRVDGATGTLEGIAVRYVADELRPARPFVVRRYEALGLRAAIGRWRHTAAHDQEDFGIVEELLERAERLAALNLDGPDEETDAPVAMCGWVSELDGARVVQIDTFEGAGRVRVMINDGPVYDGDPETDQPPGAHYEGAGWKEGRGLFSVRSLMTGETSTFRAVNESDATAQYLDVVASNLLVWPDTGADGEPGARR